jgi:hypothetical protein
VPSALPNFDELKNSTMPSFSLLKRIGREFSNNSQLGRQRQDAQEQERRKQRPEAQPPLPQQNGSAKPVAPAPAGDGSAVAEDSDHDSGVDGVSASETTTPLSPGNGKARKERRNSKRDLLLRMIGKPASTPLRGRTQSQPATPQRSTSIAVSQHVSLL